MASKTSAAKTAAPETAATPEVESTYSVDELTACAQQVFQASPDIVKAALRLAGVTKTTQKEAAKIVAAFRKKEV